MISLRRSRVPAHCSEDEGGDILEMLPHVSPEIVAEHELEGVRFGRNRMLQKIGGVVFGASIFSAMVNSKALAHGNCAHSTIAMCGPSKRCCCCNAQGCCVGGCSIRTGECPSGGWSWHAPYGGCMYNCGDWWQPHDPPHNRCICQQLMYC